MSRARPDTDPREALSALVDGEVDGSRARRLLRQVQSDEALKGQWTRYHVIRATLASTAGGAGVTPGFAARVDRMLADEPLPVVPAHANAGRYLSVRGRPLAGFAVAAVMALVVVGGLAVLQQEGGEPVADGSPLAVAPTGPHPPTMAPVSGFARVGAPLSFDAPRVMTVSPELRERLDVYLTTHAEAAASADMPGVISSGRLAGQRAGQ